MLEHILRYLKKEKVMSISLILAIVSMFIVVPDREYLTYVDVRVLALLFCLMIVVKGYQKIGLFDVLAMKMFGKVNNCRMLVLILVWLCFFSSMLITNDVALITFVPFAILALRRCKQEKYMIVTIVMQTIAANLGSMLTPVGNPQNLYLFAVSGMGIGDFLSITFPIMLISLIVLTLTVIYIPTNPIEIEITESIDMGERKELVTYTALFVLCLLVVFRVIIWPVALVITVMAVICIKQTKLFGRVDYALLITFVGFFVFIGNIGRIQIVSDTLISVMEGREILVSVICSQFMSNVPAAILLSGFTDNYAGLIAGTNIGGLGTIIASMASLISYKQYAEEEDANKGRYMLVFTGWNIVGLAILLCSTVIL